MSIQRSYIYLIIHLAAYFYWRRDITDELFVSFPNFTALPISHLTSLHSISIYLSGRAAPLYFINGGRTNI
jgi:hypothetical protein